LAYTHKRSQTEVIGLLVIVILLVVIALIYIRFSIATGTELPSTLRSNIKVTNLLQALMNVDIQETATQELSLECYYGHCQNLEEFLHEIFVATLQPNEDYRFTLLAGGDEIFKIGTCDKGIISRYPFIRDTIFLEATLLICTTTSPQ
jgi:hypothetical protein